ncbi:MAG: putative metal-binding motif-containing protein [Myxococcales bacterium]|nr:putative metal-binding motif-containing protein [Myxococcales bacterium]
MRKIVGVFGWCAVGLILTSAWANEAPTTPWGGDAGEFGAQVSASATGPGKLTLNSMFVAEKVVATLRVRFRDNRQCFDACQARADCDGVMLQMKPANSTVVCMLGTNVKPKAVKGWMAWTPVARCARQQDCDDKNFCNGQERCGWETGSVRCVKGAAPCGTGMICNAGASRCEQACSDADGDGYKSASCGFDDCDDKDGTTNPGIHETCDTKDNDCVACTVGDTDADGDGFVSAACSNPIGTSYNPGCGSNSKVYVDMAHKVVRGRDCDDSNAALKPGSMKCDPNAAYTQICTNGAWVRQACPAGKHCQSQPNGTGLCVS